MKKLEESLKWNEKDEKMSEIIWKNEKEVFLKAEL